MQKTFDDFLVQLAYQQLKDTSATDDVREGEIIPSAIQQLLDITNQGLIDISTKMKLYEGIDTLPLVEGTNIYTLAYTDYVKVLSIHGLDAWDREKIFYPKTNSHIIQPSPTTLRFSDTFIKDYGPNVDIHYHKTHPVIDDAGTMDLPAHLYEALALYVAGLYISHMGGDDHTKKGDSYYGLYLSMIGADEMENKSGTSELTDEDSRFNDRGFV